MRGLRRRMIFLPATSVAELQSLTLLAPVRTRRRVIPLP